MRNYIIISKKQADKVRGRHGKYSALEPVEFPDGRYGIPARLIDNPEFVDIKDILKEYSKGEVQSINTLNEDSEDVQIKKGKYYLSRDYWVIQGKEDFNISLKQFKRLSKANKHFLFKKDIVRDVNLKKDYDEANEKSFVPRNALKLRAKTKYNYSILEDKVTESGKQLKDKVLKTINGIVKQ